MGRYMRTDLGAGHTRLSPPTVIFPFQVPFVTTTLAPSPTQGRAAHSSLRLPVAIDVTPQTQYLSVNLTYSSRGVPKSRFVTPAPVVNPETTFLAAPVVVHNTYSVRIRGKSHLRRPLVVFDAVRFFGPSAKLAYSLRGKPKSHLRRPIVVFEAGPAAVYYGPQVHLARNKPQPTGPALSLPVVVADAIRFPGPETKLAFSRRGVTKSRLQPPTTLVAVPTQVYGGPLTSLAYSVRGVAKASLTAPIVIEVRSALPSLAVSIAYAVRGNAKSRLTRAVVVVVPSAALARPLLVHLAYSRTGRGFSSLGRPNLDLRPQVISPAITLVRNGPQPTTTLLRPPIVITAVVSPQTNYLAVYTTYSVRGRAKWGLAPPAVVLVIVPTETAPPLLVHLAYSRRGVGFSWLRRPALDQRPQVVYLSVTLAPSKRVRGNSVLKPPIVLARAVFAGPTVQLAYSLRGTAKSELRPAIVIDLRPQVYYLSVSLTQIRPQPTHSQLSPSAVTEALPKAERELRVTLTYSVRGQPKSWLRRPPLEQSPKTQFLSVNLTYSSRGRPTSELRAPAVVGQPPVRPTKVTFAYQSRKRGRALLRPPAVVAPVLARPVEVTLTKQYRPSLTAFLRPPTVIIPLQNIPTVTTLVRNKPQPTTTLLRPPTRVFPFIARQLQATLVRNKPPERFWKLQPPSAVRGAVLHPIRVVLTPSRRLVAKYGLAPPAIVRIPEPVLHPILTALAYSLRGTPKPFFITRPIEKTFIPPQGDICGDDQQGDTDVCGDDEASAPESTISGGDSASGSVVGNDQENT